MRLFVAVPLAESVRAAAETVAEKARGGLDPRLRASWIPPEKMHLTVRFIGHVDDGRVPAVLEALAPPLPVLPFEIALDSCGAFPRSGPPRVFWISLSEGVEPLRQMHDELNRRLLTLGVKAEDRAFRVHLTLARVKEVPANASRAIRETLAQLSVPAASCRVDHAVVFQSQLSPKGSTYVPLIRVSCRPA
jgi:RNA 2',3'-cyclic 3'-phosphodiesterase